MTQMIYRPRQYEFARSVNEAIIYTAQKMKFSIKDFLSKFDQIRNFPADWVIFTEDIRNGKLHFFVQCYINFLCMDCEK